MTVSLAAMKGAIIGQAASPERRMTVLVADLCGFTSFCESREGEVAFQAVQHYLEALGRIVSRHGGKVSNYWGDSLIAVFGPGEDEARDARRAVSAALEMREAVASLPAGLRKALGDELEVRIGVNTGTVYSGRVGLGPPGREALFGDTINVAARLETRAGRGRTLVGPGTYALTRDDFEYRPRGPLRVRGRRQPVPAYELLAPAPQALDQRLASRQAGIAPPLLQPALTGARLSWMRRFSSGVLEHAGSLMAVGTVLVHWWLYGSPLAGGLALSQASLWETAQLQLSLLMRAVAGL